MFGLFKKKPEPIKPDASRIVPRIKSTEFLAAIRNLGASADDVPVTEPLVGDLLVTYAFDLPEIFQMLTHRDMAALGLTPAGVRTAAIANLRGQIREIRTEGELPVLMLVTGNDLEACLLLLDDVWPAFAAKVAGEVVVAVPTRSIVLLSSSDSAPGLRVLREAIVESQRHEATHSLSQHLLIRRDSRWQIFAGDQKPGGA
jgi:uncharacterized protein YtpQ (UPF0354 family)